MNPADTIFRMLYANNYRAFGYDSTDHTKWNTRDVFNVFASFDFSVFGHTSFLILDHNLFKPQNDSFKLIATQIDTLVNVTGRTSTVSIDCVTWQVCSTLAVARQNSMADPCQTYQTCTIYDTGGGGGGGFIGSGNGTGGGGSGGGTGWYGGGSPNPCPPGGPVQKTSILQPIDCGPGWVPVNGSNLQNIADERDPNLTDTDPDLKWWDENVSDPNTIYYQQTKPTFDNVYNNYPKDANGDDMPADQVYNLVGGEPLSLYLADPIKNGNACAVRVSRALNYSGVAIPYIANQTYKGADGKYYFLGAAKLYNWIVKTFGSPNVHLTAADGAPNGTNFKSKIMTSLHRGIYIMKPISQASFQATGHATLWGGLDCIGGHNYFAAAKDIYIWDLN